MEIKFHDVIQQKLKGKNLSEIARKIDLPKAVLHDWVSSKLSIFTWPTPLSGQKNHFITPLLMGFLHFRTPLTG